MNVAMSALVGAGLAAAVVAAPRGDVVRAAGPCEFSGFVVVAKNESGRVVRRQEALDDGQSFGCLYRFGKRIPLDDPRGSVAVVQPRSVRLAGWLAGYALDEARERLDMGADIDIFSLRLSGSTLSWTRAGKTYSSRLD
jgi:hypothetical protein